MSALYHFNFSNSETERFFDDLTLGLLHALNSVMGVENVMAVVTEGLTPEEIIEWQREMEYPLPQDLVSFYSLLNGIHITWGYKMRNNALLKVGLLKIASLYDLKPLGYIRNAGDDARYDFFATLDTLSEEDQPKFNTNFKIIQLESTRDSSTVCLVYSKARNSHTIWLLDRSLQWHYITDSFTKYFHLMVKNAGLPQWQLGQTVLGMAMWAKQLMYTFALCLLSPPTSGLQTWLVDPSRSRASYLAACADPTAVKFAEKKSMEYSGYFSDKAPVSPKPESLCLDDSTFDDTKAVDGTLSNLENLPRDETTVTAHESMTSQGTSTSQDSTTNLETTVSLSSNPPNSDPSEPNDQTSNSEDDTFTTTQLP